MKEKWFSYNTLVKKSTKWKTYLNKYIKNLESYFDAPVTLSKIFSLRGIPTSILINKNGEEFARIIGSIDFNDKKFIYWLKDYN